MCKGEVMSRLGDNIHNIRLAKGKTIEVVSELAQINRKTLTRIERSGNIIVDSLLRIARALEVKPSELFEGVE